MRGDGEAEGEEAPDVEVRVAGGGEFHVEEGDVAFGVFGALDAPFQALGVDVVAPSALLVVLDESLPKLGAIRELRAHLRRGIEVRVPFSTMVTDRRSLTDRSTGVYLIATTGVLSAAG